MTSTAEVVLVTPEMAEQWLIEARAAYDPLVAPNLQEGSVIDPRDGRVIPMRQVDDLAEVIKRGEWVLNGDAIMFDADGRLQDGVYRLLAIAKAGEPVRTLVLRPL